MLGFLGPLSGPASSYGIMAYRVASIAVEDFNDKNNLKVVLKAEDAKCSGKEAVNSFRKLVNLNGVKIVLGGICSTETLAVAQIANRERVVLLTPMSASHKITHAGDYVFRNTPSELEAISAIIDFVSNSCHKNVAIVHEKTDFGEGATKLIREKLTDLRDVRFITDSFLPNEKDFRSLSLKLLSAAPSLAILVAQTGQTAAGLITELRQKNINSVVILPYLGSDKSFRENLKGKYHNVLSVEFEALDRLNERVLKLFKTYQARFGEEISMPMDAGRVYDAVMILAQAIKTVGYQPEKIKTYLNTMGKYQGLLDSYEFDANGDVEGVKHLIYAITDSGQLAQADLKRYAGCKDEF